MNKKISKQQMVLDHLKKYGTITSLEAITLYSATRLAAIIFNLRNKFGYDIETNMESDIDKYGNSVNYARYIYHGKTEFAY